ncbi:MAG TPA: DNA repair protein RecN, partial [Legionellaceae bacterium]|nr:DNA repair protein RecN [Legionellaceae bacterium]
KSIMIDALLLALGERADTNIIRAGTEKCDIQACFSYLACSETAQWLTEHEIEQEENHVVLRRVLTIDGRSKAYINGVVFPLQKLKELSETLIHIHGQHHHQKLLSHNTHRDQLDHFADHGKLREAVAIQYHICQKLKEERLSLMQAQSKDVMPLIEDLKELQAFNPSMDEMDSLHKEHQLLHHAKEYLENTQNVMQIMQSEEGMSLRHSLHMVMQTLHHLPQHHTHIQTAKSLIENASICLNEAYDELESFGESIQIDPERLFEVEQRMSTLHHLARKHHISVHDLPAHIQTLQKTLQESEEIAQRKAQIEQEYCIAEQTYQELALELRASRIKHAKILASKITTHMQELGMPNGFLDIMCTPLETMQAHGLDKIEYKVAPNPGMQPELLTKIASGGELSRISLAIQMIAAQQGNAPTLFFDEVDVGIGGATAAIIGRHLRILGERFQVFCVTHQPQVAASAHHHFVVKKTVEQDQTYSQVLPLQAEYKIEEIARMLGGLTITQKMRHNAQELIESLTTA